MRKAMGFVFGLAAVLAMGYALPVGADTAKAGDDLKINGKPAPDVIATVNGVNVTSEALKSEMAAYKMVMERQGREIDPQEQEKLVKDVVGRAIDEELIYQKSKEMKVQVSPETVLKEMDQIRAQFPSEELFKSALAFQNHTVASLKTKIERKLVEEEFIRREIAPKASVDDQRVEAFYNENQQYFMKPELYEVSHIFASAAAPNEGKADDPATRQKAQRILSQLDQSARSKIDAVLQKLKKEESFADLAKKYSEDESTKNNGGSMGTLPRDNLIPELADAMVKLKPGEFSDMVKSPYGYHVVKLTSKTPQHMTPFAEAKPDILNYLLKQEVEAKRKAYLDQLKKTAKIKTFL
ncbi:MAG: peptidylprolyl isomerase [Nitrospinae bacterium]|nr:peptidylprolyl isomerase [Nitrospinota bacterium]